MHRTFRVNATLVAVVALAMGGLLASCGSSSKTSTATTKASAASTAPATTKSPATKSAGSDVLVTAKKNDKLGTILADKSGMTLYTLSNNGKAVACTGGCLQAWPPLVAPGGSATPQGAAGITGLNAVMGAGGQNLVATKGLPLYRFVQDKDGEDAYGEGIKSFGGVWHVVKTTATPTATAPEKSADTSSSTTATTSSSGY